jgi:phosphate transport system permease protein
MTQPSTRPKGEVFVWVTGMGLAVGLVMVALLLVIIVSNGVSVFWPKRVALVTLEEGAEYRGSRQVAGVVMLEQARDARDLSPEQLASDDPRDRREKQLFIGNRDVYGEAFRFLRLGAIAELSYPKDIALAERMEWGNAIFWPLRLELRDGGFIASDDAGFRDALARTLGEVNARRKAIDRIERRKIGRINLEMRELQLQENYLLHRAEEGGGRDELSRVRGRMDELQAAYEPLAARARELREEQRGVTLHYRLATGEERAAPMADFVHLIYPNQMGLFARAGAFVGGLWNFVTGYPREANTEGGIFPAIFGTVVMTLIMSVLVMPFGVLAAIYLREYAKQGPLVRAVRIAVNNLAGVPSIVYGIFGLGFFVYLVGGTIDQIFYPQALASNTPTFGTGGILWASFTLALMTVPVVIVATEESLASVSRGVREGSLACGASKWQTIQRVVLPASAPGILTGLILAMARGAGEVAPLMLVGVVALAPNLPVDTTFPFIHLERKFMHLGFYIYDLGFQSPDSEAAKPMVFATTLVLITLVVLLNIVAIRLRNRLRKKYAAAKF